MTATRVSFSPEGYVSKVIIVIGWPLKSAAVREHTVEVKSQKHTHIHTHRDKN